MKRNAHRVCLGRWVLVAWADAAPEVGLVIEVNDDPADGAEAVIFTFKTRETREISMSQIMRTFGTAKPPVAAVEKARLRRAHRMDS